MTKLKPVLWMLSGVALGCSATALALPDQTQGQPPTTPRMVAQAMRPGEPPVRLTSVFAGHVRASDVYFVKDTKSAGCWIATVIGDSQSSIAVAPKEACE